MIDLSVIIVSYNTKELTKECIESVVKSVSKKINYEIIVVDNKSKDGSQGTLRSLWRKHSNIVLVENKQNVGFAAAVNIGIEKAKGEYIFLLNSDTKVKKGSLLKIIEFAKSRKDAGVVGARLVNPDGSIQASCFNFPTLKNAFKEYWLGIDGAFDKFTPKGKRGVNVEAVVAAAVLITPSAIEKVGLLDDRYFMYFEDLDYCRRVWEKGLKVYYFPGSEIVHHHGASGKNIKSKETQWKRLIPSSKLYHGAFMHHLISFILWSGQKWRR